MSFVEFGLPKVMLLFEEGSLAQVLKARLNHEGFGVTCLPASEGACWPEVIWPDIVLVQQQSASDKGLQFLSQLAKKPGIRPARIMVLGPGDQRDLERAFAAGIDDWLRTPFSVQTLVALLRQLLQK